MHVWCPVMLLRKIIPSRHAVAHVNSAGGRSQRASARSLAVAALPAGPIVVPEVAASSSHPLSDFDPQMLPIDSEDVLPSRATSFHEDSPPEALESAKRNRGRVKDKGKGKEREMMIKVKEEPVMVSLSNELSSLGVRSLLLSFPHPQIPIPMQSNEDHCSACRSLGALVYCDGCPRAFHWICLDPPMEATDLPEGETRWFCPACTLEKVWLHSHSPRITHSSIPPLKKPAPKPPTSLKFMAPLVNELAAKIPTEYQLPSDVRSFFKDGEFTRRMSSFPSHPNASSSWYRAKRRISGHIRSQAGTF